MTTDKDQERETGTRGTWTVCQCRLCWKEAGLWVQDWKAGVMTSKFPEGWRRIESRMACDECVTSYQEWMRSRLQQPHQT